MAKPLRLERSVYGFDSHPGYYQSVEGEYSDCVEDRIIISSLQDAPMRGRSVHPWMGAIQTHFARAMHMKVIKGDGITGR